MKKKTKTEYEFQYFNRWDEWYGFHVFINKRSAMTYLKGVRKTAFPNERYRVIKRTITEEESI